jgi:hypothetical protein
MKKFTSQGIKKFVSIKVEMGQPLTQDIRGRNRGSGNAKIIFMPLCERSWLRLLCCAGFRYEMQGKVQLASRIQEMINRGRVQIF